MGKKYTADNFIKQGGTSSQFLMADGSTSAGGGGSAANAGVHLIVKPNSGQQVTSGMNTATSQLLGVANKVMLYPFIPRYTITSSALSMFVATVGGGGNAKIVLYSDLNGYPNTKIYESTDLSCATTGAKTATTTQTFTAGTTYWMGVFTSSTPTLSTFGAGALMPLRGESVILTYQSYFISGLTYPTIPTTIDIGSLYTNSQAPYIVAITVQ